ncbi:uncharacterized protein [Trachinotus anak]|uniref:uncharacterized protein isoform X2 n=1 Tax=Trachinotus anak TaxID=443729 RepID=UPI0039F188C9
MMACMLVHVLLTVLLSEAFGSLVPAGEEPASSCPPQWLPFGQRCFAFYPVWSSWSTATISCSQTGSHLVSLHTPEEKQFMRLLANSSSPVWLGGYQPQQNGSWFWSDNSPFSISGPIHQRRGETTEGRVCLEMAPKSGGLHGAPCEELRFFICSIKANSSDAAVQDKSGENLGVSLFDLMWIHSHLLPETILRSSNFLRDLRSGNLTERCYNNFIQQEALYLHRVSSKLKVLISRLQEADDMKPLLMDTFERYSSRNQSPPAFAPRWLNDSLQSFQLVDFEEPVYWLVALSARARLHSFLAEELHLDKLRPGPQQGSGSVADSFYQDWSKDNQGEVAWTQRFKEVMEKHQNKMNTDYAISIFRQHMMNQKTFYKKADCDDETHG